MIKISSVQAFDHELAWEAKVLTHFEPLFIYILCREVFSDAAVVSVRQLSVIILIIKQIVYVNIVNVTLDTLQIYV